MFPATSTKSAIRPEVSGRFSRLVQKQEELNARLTRDPLIDLKSVRSILGISYSQLNRLIKERKLPVWQACPHGSRRVRSSALDAYLASGDQPRSEQS